MARACATISRGRCSARSGRGAGKLTRTALPQANAHAMIRRRAAAVGIETKLGNHSFRARLCANARSGCSHATIESKAQLRRIFDACAACRLNQSCARMARRMVFAQPRATGITAYLKNGGTLEKAAAMANHASTRTTQLYDRRRDEVSLNEVERIVI